MMRSSFQHIATIDSHTAGEPTRVVVAGGPKLGTGPLADRVTAFVRQYDHFRRAIICEPRGIEIAVGALLVPPHDPHSDLGVIFFNNTGPLGMCGHAAMGVIASLAYLGRISAGEFALETPAGKVPTYLHGSGRIAVTNVASYRQHRAVSVTVPSLGRVCGDIAWGGNWFYLISDPPLSVAEEDTDKLTHQATAVRHALHNAGYTHVDHVEWFGPPRRKDAHARNFVLCPGGVYDRSPCGTGTSAKLACLSADNRIREGDTWVQEGIVGTTFQAQFVKKGDSVLVTLTGEAFVTAESTLVMDPADPLGWGRSR